MTLLYPSYEWGTLGGVDAAAPVDYRHVNARSPRDRLCGCYVTVPTPFRDSDLSVDLAAVQTHVRFLIEHGLTTGTGVLLAGGGAGDFSTMTFDERVDVAAAVVEAAA